MSTGPTRLSRCCASACERSPRLELCRWSHSLCQTLVGALNSCKPTISWISSSWRFFETLPKMSCCGVSVANEISRPPAEKARGWEGVEVGTHQQPLHRIYFRNLFFCVYSKHLLTFDQLTCTLARSSQQDWKGTLDCWGTCRTYGPSLFWALGGRRGQGQEPDRGESSLHRHRPGPGKRGSKFAGTSLHSYWQTTY